MQTFSRASRAVSCLSPSLLGLVKQILVPLLSSGQHLQIQFTCAPAPSDRLYLIHQIARMRIALLLPILLRLAADQYNSGAIWRNCQTLTLNGITSRMSRRMANIGTGWANPFLPGNFPSIWLIGLFFCQVPRASSVLATCDFAYAMYPEGLRFRGFRRTRCVHGLFQRAQIGHPTGGANNIERQNGRENLEG